MTLELWLAIVIPVLIFIFGQILSFSVLSNKISYNAGQYAAVIAGLKESVNKVELSIKDWGEDVKTHSIIFATKEDLIREVALAKENLIKEVALSKESLAREVALTAQGTKTLGDKLDELKEKFSRFQLKNATA